MRFIEMREQLKDFYLHYIDDKADEFCVACENILNNNYNSNMSIYDMKLMQYEVITEEFEPQILSKVPFYYEMGTMISWCDGSRNFHGHTHPGGWVARKLENKYVEANPELHELASRQRSELFYLICGYYNDSMQHFAFNYRPVFEMGLKGVYEKAKAKMAQAVTEKEKKFLNL